MARLAEKSAIVTGGGRGIGRAIVEAFLAEDASVVTCGRGSRPDDLPASVRWVTADVSRNDDVLRLREEAGETHIVVNNAGIQIERNTVDTTDADWDLIMGANAKGVFQMCRAFIPVLSESGGGNIINIGSISGNVADPDLALYNASKAFVHGLTRSIATDHGKDGVRCNAICPGWIMTEMADAAFDLATNPTKAKEDALARHAAGRFGSPEDIARATVWLASDDAAFVTGQTFTIDGGLTTASPLRPGLF